MPIWLIRPIAPTCAGLGESVAKEAAGAELAAAAGTVVDAGQTLAGDRVAGVGVVGRVAVATAIAGLAGSADNQRVAKPARRADLAELAVIADRAVAKNAAARLQAAAAPRVGKRARARCTVCRHLCVGEGEGIVDLRGAGAGWPLAVQMASEGSMSGRAQRACFPRSAHSSCRETDCSCWRPTQSAHAPSTARRDDQQQNKALKNHCLSGVSPPGLQPPHTDRG